MIDFKPDINKIDIRKELTTEENNYLRLLLTTITEDFSEKTLENCCLPATIELERFMARIAEDNSLDARELVDTVKTALFGLLRKYTIINLDISKQAFKHEMK